MSGCTCPEPVENINPRHLGHCVKCSKVLDPAWLSSDANLGAFFESLAESTFPAYGRSLDRTTIPQWFFEFYRDCSGRERSGRKKFGLEYLHKSGPAEAQEEAADLALYLYLETLRRRRLGEDEEANAALTGAMYAAKAYETCRRMAQHDYKTFSEAETN